MTLIFEVQNLSEYLTISSYHKKNIHTRTSPLDGSVALCCSKK